MKVNIDESIISLEELWKKIDKMRKKTLIKVEINSKELAKILANELEKEM